MRRAAAVVAAFLVATALLGGSAAVLSESLSSARADPGAAGAGIVLAPTVGAPGGTGGPAVPPDWEALDQRAAAAACPGLPWAVLAAIGRVESDSGRAVAPGVWSGANAAGAEGPMQFEPGTFAAYGIAGPGGAVPPSPYDPVDAVYTAARLLCADGGSTRAGLQGAIFDYDHSTTYVETVLVLALAIGSDPALRSPPADVVAFAAAQLGDPYRWGGTGAGGFDCSGLAQAAERAAGVVVPRVAQAQFDAGPAIPSGEDPEPGDLLFFGASPRAVGHVGIYVGAGMMIDAPHSGASVRLEAPWGDFVGATRPS